MRCVQLPSADVFVRTLYGSLCEQADFRSCLPLIADTFGAHIVALHEEDLFAGCGRAELHGALEAAELTALGAEYAQRWSAENILIQRCTPGMLTQGFQSPDEVIGTAELLASAYYRHYLRRVDVRHGVGIALMRHGDQRLSMLAVNRSARMGPLVAEELAFVRAVRPHIANAYALSRRFRAVEDENLSLRAGIERLPLGVLLLDPQGRVRYANDAAYKLFDARRGIRLDATRRVRLTARQQQIRLDEMLIRLVSTSSPAMPETLVVGPAGIGHPLMMCLHVVPAQAGSVIGPDRRLIAFLWDLDRSGEERLALASVQRAMGLTVTEARIALAMRRHHEPERVAVALGLSPATVRTHLKHAFRKAGVSKQAELTRRVDRIVSLIP